LCNTGPRPTNVGTLPPLSSLNFLTIRGQRYKGIKEKYWTLSVSTSVGEILLRTADAFPAASPFPIGASLMQVTLSPQEAADLLFY
jgi:hypothetical protein